MAVFTVIQIYKVALQLNSSIYCKIKLLYDGECPDCAREVNFLQKSRSIFLSPHPSL
jgi:hypothetical protein